ncbi:hypothetical protein ACS126_16500 [Sphingobacterium lactis]|uniref:hypothetical protein n=1 Tax=Sphingobacterium lactis TaxID=797291 RepID=UPI003EC5C7CB
MINLELEKIGAHEMSLQEMTNTEGGLVSIVGTIAKFVVGAWLTDSIFNLNTSTANFMEGYNSVRN